MEKIWELKVICENTLHLGELTSHLLMMGNIDFNVKVLTFGVVGYKTHGSYEVAMSSRYPNLSAISQKINEMKLPSINTK